MTILSTFKEIGDALMSETTLPVQIWMFWMGLIFFVSIFFMRRHSEARVVFAAMLLTGFCVMNVWAQVRNVHLFGVAHFLVWAPLAAFLTGAVLSKKGKEKHKDAHRHFYNWVLLLVVTITVSLIFDARDIYLVMMDQK